MCLPYHRARALQTASLIHNSQLEDAEFLVATDPKQLADSQERL